MNVVSLSSVHEAEIAHLVDHYKKNIPVFETFLKQLRGVLEHTNLLPYTHSLKARLKDPEHLRDKLARKMAAALNGGPTFDITTDNLFEKINDLVGVRLLHLHTRQVVDIHRELMALFDDSRIQVREAFARTWDLESTAFFKNLGIETRDSASYYTSVHYVVDPMAKTTRTAEIQVRTLAEEIWGEVDHTINYPHRSHSVSCREQLMVLARVTSSCSRLVDSIFATHTDGLQDGNAGSGPPPE